MEWFVQLAVFEVDEEFQKHYSVVIVQYISSTLRNDYKTARIYSSFV